MQRLCKSLKFQFSSIYNNATCIFDAAMVRARLDLTTSSHEANAISLRYRDRYKKNVYCGRKGTNLEKMKSKEHKLKLYILDVDKKLEM